MSGSFDPVVSSSRLRAASPPSLIVHCCHHRTGTVWFKNVLTGCADRLGLTFFEGEQDDLPETAGVFLQNHSSIRARDLPAFRGTHMIRDPRDVVVSGYYYHLSCDEAWCLAPQKRYGGRSYQQVLRELEPGAGIEFEMRQAASATFREMLRWSYRDARFLELRYEDLIADESGVFRRIFEHYGLTREQQNQALEIADSRSFERVTERPLGTTDNSKHLRHGKPGQWRDQFNARNLALSRKLFGRGAARLGYDLC